MSIKDMKVLNNTSSIELPDWIKFAFELGAYINDHGVKYKKPINLILSLPSGHSFSLLIAIGITDKTFSLNKQRKSIMKTILSLEQGSRIIYKDEQSTRKASVISIEPSPVFENEKILKIKDGKMERGIPERYWVDRVIILDEEFDEIKSTRIVSKNQKIGLDESPFLRTIYSPNQLNKTAFYPGDIFYLVGNIAQIDEYLRDEVFFYNGVKGSFADFLYFDNKNSYTNGKLFSSQMKKNEVGISAEIPVIYSDLNSYIKQDRYFTKNPKIIIASRTDNENRINEVKEEIKRELLQGEYKIVTQEIVDYLESNNTQIPFGVEFLAWR